ncbi:MAG: efflux RND transporter periplasmic adaptor subunit [Deferribacteraceae bacterium]|jgi:membrane fusion protein (multidrug efflux system)|nr:efflux RND transporter periplasmic adaptor subunit [Deferribacteraceae bacterium]
MLKKVFVLFCAFAAITGCKNPAGETQLPPPTVIVSPVTPEDVSPTSSFLGKLEAESKAAIVPRVSGVLQKRLVKEGDIVKKGQPLFIIDKRPYQIAVNQAEAAVNSAKATADSAKLAFDRAKRSFDRKAIPKAQYDNANAVNRSAQAALKGAVAALEAAKLNLTYTDITSPTAGKIGIINFNEGEQVGPTVGVITNLVGSGPISATFSMSSRTLADLRKRFSVLVDAQLLVQIRNKANLELILSDGTVYPEPGNLTFADNAVSAAADSRRFKASFPNPKGDLLPGQTVTVRITFKAPVTTIVVPQSAILNDVGGKYVLAVSNSGVVSRRGVSLGAELPGGKQVINGGLNDGDVIIVEGVQKAQPGGTVNALSREDYNKLLTSQR